MNNYYFKINNVDAKVSENGLSNVIKRVHYSYFVEDEQGNKYHLNDTILLPDPQPETFVSADQLLQSDIISWIEPLIENIDNIKAGLDAQLAEKVTPTIVRLTIPETNEPVVEEPAAEEAPAAEVPNIEEPATEEAPVAEEPASEEPASEEPAEVSNIE